LWLGKVKTVLFGVEESKVSFGFEESKVSFGVERVKKVLWLRRVTLIFWLSRVRYHSLFPSAPLSFTLTLSPSLLIFFYPSLSISPSLSLSSSLLIPLSPSLSISLSLSTSFIYECLRKSVGFNSSSQPHLTTPTVSGFVYVSVYVVE
jgi:hypothetical protein